MQAAPVESLQPTEADVALLLERLSDPWWRITNLYWIVDEDGHELQFIPNDEQRDLYSSIGYWNLILKARQLGFTTLLTIMALDQVLFVRNFTAAIIAHRLPDAEKIFRNKVLFAYRRLPEAIRERIPVKKETTSELVFANGSSISVSTSARSGTVQWLHVSEFGSVCARFPEKAREIVTGSFNAVPRDGLIFIESTAEGQAGYFYDYCMAALRAREEERKPARGQWKLHFYPWHTKASYALDDESVQVEPELIRYFEGLERDRGITLTMAQKRWYSIKSAVMGDDMKREFPSYPQEAFEQAIKGAIYANQMAWMRTNNRITNVPHDPKIPVNTFWDLGINDTTAIWLHQRVGQENRFIGYYQNSSEGLAHYVKWLQERPMMVWGQHYLPHDADARMLTEHGETRREILQRLGLKDMVVVKRIDEITTGIDMTRSALPTCWIDRVACAEGIRALDSYQYEWNEETGAFRKQPLHNWASNGADAIRQFAQGYVPSTGSPGTFRRHRDNWRA
jgi:hypothetical protein